MAKRRPQSAGASMSIARLAILRESDEAAFAAAALEMLESRDRLEREAALEALADHPVPAAREPVRRRFFELDADGLKHDQGAHQRVNIVRILRAIGDHRDTDVAIRASDTHEKPFGEDTAWNLRAHGLMMLAEIAPDAFPYYAVEHLGDGAGPNGNEPANTAVQLLIGTGQLVAVYEWLSTVGRDSPHLSSAFELFAEHAPADIIARFVRGTIEQAIRTGDEPLCLLFADVIVEKEIEASYPVLGDLLFAKISDELYTYLATRLAATNRAPLLAILEEQLHRGRRPRLILESLNVRPTREQKAIIKRWEDGD